MPHRSSAFATLVSLVVVASALPAQAGVRDDVRGVLAGLVRTSVGAPVSGVCVDASFDDGVSWGNGWALTGADGRWRMPGLPVGEYAVRLDDCAEVARYRSRLYPDARTLRGAQRVPVRAGATTLISATLGSPGGRRPALNPERPPVLLPAQQSTVADAPDAPETLARIDLPSHAPGPGPASMLEQLPAPASSRSP